MRAVWIEEFRRRKPGKRWSQWRPVYVIYSLKDFRRHDHETMQSRAARYTAVDVPAPAKKKGRK